MDLESYLRDRFKEDPEAAQQFFMYTNQENRMVIQLGDRKTEYIVFGNNVCEPPPPAQTAGVQGFDSHKGMGEK